MKHISREEEKKVIEYYLNGHTQIETGKIFGRTQRDKKGRWKKWPA